MDSTSIITQASRDDELFPSAEKGKGKFFQKWRSAGNDVAQQGACSYKKQRHRGLLSSLLCCLKAPSSHANGAVQRLDSSSPKLPAKYLLPPACHQDARKKCMVIDLDETLVHSSFKPVSNADFVVPVEIDGAVHQVYVQKRPYVDEFLQKMGELYECVLFTASLAKYADPVADLLDKWGVFRARLFRESCVLHQGNYVKDLGRLGRDLQKVIIVDNSPASYIFHPDNAVAVASWFDDASDTELRDLVPFFENLSRMENVYSVLRNSNRAHQHHHRHSLPSCAGTSAAAGTTTTTTAMTTSTTTTTAAPAVAGNIAAYHRLQMPPTQST